MLVDSIIKRQETYFKVWDILIDVIWEETKREVAKNGVPEQSSDKYFGVLQKSYDSSYDFGCVSIFKMLSMPIDQKFYDFKEVIEFFFDNLVFCEVEKNKEEFTKMMICISEIYKSKIEAGILNRTKVVIALGISTQEYTKKIEKCSKLYYFHLC